MKEGQQQHLLSATLLNLRLTRENTEEKNRLLRMIQEKDETIADLQKQLKQVQDEREYKLDDLVRQVGAHGQHVEWMLTRLTAGLLPYVTRHRPGFALHDFTLTEFSKCQGKGHYGDWFSEPFYSHPGGYYKFKLNVDTNGYGSANGEYMSVRIWLLKGDHDDKVAWPVTHTAHVLLLNQLGDFGHTEEISKGSWSKGERGSYGGCIQKFIKLNELGLDAGKNIQYLRNDTLHFRVYFNALPSS